MGFNEYHFLGNTSYLPIDDYTAEKKREGKGVTQSRICFSMDRRISVALLLNS